MRAGRRAVFASVLAMLLLLILGSSGAQAVDYSAQEVRFVEILNDYRQSLGREPLMVSDLCSDAAEKHCLDMIKYGFVGHRTVASDWFPDGADGRVRLALCGYGGPLAWGENIAAGYSLAGDVFQGWKSSTKGHHEIMIDPAYRVVGIARVQAPGTEYGYYWTADFGSLVDQAAHWVDDSGPTTTTSTTTTSTSTTTSTTSPTSTTTSTTSPGGSTTTTTLAARPFVDVPLTNRFYDPITRLAAAGVVSGYAGGMFYPENPVTRAQFAKIIVSALEKHTPQIDNAGAPTFCDVAYSGSPYPFDYVEEATLLGIVQGYADGRFAPQENVTRLQLALMLVRAGGDTLATPPAGYSCRFVDVPGYARSAINTGLYNGLFSGKTATKFDPYSVATRGHVAKMVYGLTQVTAP